MARKLSTRKRPDRDDFRLKEALKIEEGVFDQRTIMIIGKFFTRNIISKLDYIIARGKEADVYLADSGSKITERNVVVKIFRIETSSFHKRVDYINGDPRFKGVHGNLAETVTIWCRKEYGNLKIAEEAGVRAPRAYSFLSNVLAIEFIGEEDTPAETLRMVGTPEPEKTLDMIISDMKKLYTYELVHGDMSEYNILMKGSTPYIIDFGQAVTLGHPKSMEMLVRDVANIASFFRKKYGIDSDEEKLLSKITSAKKKVA